MKPRATRPRATPARRARGRAAAALTTLATLAAFTACATSPAPRRVARADSPYGAVGTVRLVDGREHSGELLAVQDSSLVVLAGNRVVVGRFADIARVAWGDFSSRRFGAAVWRSPGLREKGRLASRFPYGLPAPAMAALLARLGQAAPDTLRAGAR